MKMQRTSGGSAGIELIRRLAGEGDRLFTVDRARELAPAAGITQSYLIEALHHLNRSGWIMPLRRGLYAITATMPGVVPAHEYEIAMALIRPAAISHWSALHHHGLTQQIPRTVFILTTTDVSVPRHRRAGSKPADGYTVAGHRYRFVQVRPERYFGVQTVWIGEAQVTITDPERTLLDGLMMPHYCGDFSEVLHAFEVHHTNMNLDRLIEHAFRLDDATIKRLGWILEHQGVPMSRLQRLREHPIRGYRRLDPGGPKAGPYSGVWHVQENLPGKVHP